MNRRIAKYISLILVALMLVGLCACGDLLANFNEGMTEEDYEYDPEAAREGGGKWMPILISILIIAVGVVGLVAPQGLWWLENGWKFRDAEPSKLALTLNRVLGGAVILVGVVVLIWAVAT